MKNILFLLFLFPFALCAQNFNKHQVFVEVLDTTIEKTELKIVPIVDKNGYYTHQYRSIGTGIYEKWIFYKYYFFDFNGLKRYLPFKNLEKPAK